MKKDIEIPEVQNVFVAVIQEENQDFRTKDWNVYIINNNNFSLETVLIVSKGNLGKTETSTMRHSISVLPAKAFAKVEFLTDEVLNLNNEFSVSFFSEGKMMHENFIFQKGSIAPEKTEKLPIIPKKGILAKKGKV